MIIAQELVKKIYRIITDKFLVLCVDEGGPVLLGKPPQDIVVLRIELDIVLVEVLKQGVGAENFGNLYQLI